MSFKRGLLTVVLLIFSGPMMSQTRFATTSVSEIRKSVRIVPLKVDDQLSLIRRAGYSLMMDTVFEEYLSLSKERPNDAHVWYLIGVSGNKFSGFSNPASKRSKEEVAKLTQEAFRTAIRLDPKSPYVRLIGSEYFLLDTDRAADVLKAKAAVKEFPNLARAHSGLGALTTLKGWPGYDPKLAENSFKRASQLDPDSASPHMGLFTLYIQPEIKRYSDAIAHYEMAETLVPESYKKHRKSLRGYKEFEILIKNIRELAKKEAKSNP